MLYIINTVFFLTCFLACSNAKTESQYLSNKSDTLKAIFEIKKQFNEINSNGRSFNIIEKNIYNESSEGAYLIGYYKNTELKKILAVYYGEIGKSVYEYYFLNGVVFFIYNKDFIYDRPIYIAGFKTKTIENNRYYFSNEQLFFWIDKNNKNVNSSSVSFRSISKDLKNNIEEVKKFMPSTIPVSKKVGVGHDGDTVMCKYGVKCHDSKFVIKGSRDSLGGVIHVKKPKAKFIPIEE
jgi:hypothetical protein